MKKYRTDWKTIIVVIGVSLSLWILGNYMQVQEGILPRDSFFGGVLIVVIPILLGILLGTIYSYAIIEGVTLRFVYFLFYRRTIDIKSITEINDQPTYKIAKSSFRSLYIFYKDSNGATKWIELRITIFPEKTLGELIKDLKRINPRIELNTYSQKLMDSVS